MKTSIKLDAHVHTKYSADSFTTLKEVHKICMKRNILPAITDHNTIEGAVLYKKRYSNCLIGEEITTKQGEIIGLFLRKAIPPFLSKEETCKEIKKQGGLIYVPHPFDIFRESIDNLNFDFDIIESFNSRSSKRSNQKAWQFAQLHNIPKAVGSDAHFAHDIGKSYLSIKNFSSPKEFLENLKNAKPVTSYSSFVLLALTKIIKLVKVCFRIIKKI
ncbi:PHP domain-containing protein [archaeon]|nr:PHP domain-containing protein [archaeon]